MENKELGNELEKRANAIIELKRQRAKKRNLKKAVGELNEFFYKGQREIALNSIQDCGYLKESLLENPEIVTYVEKTRDKLKVLGINDVLSKYPNRKEIVEGTNSRLVGLLLCGTAVAGGLVGVLTYELGDLLFKHEIMKYISTAVATLGAGKLTFDKLGYYMCDKGEKIIDKISKKRINLYIKKIIK